MKWDKLTLHKSRGGLGFRDMEAFNLSMFGKQSWKLLTDSNSLLTRVLKAKYFPRRDFLDAPLGHNPSYTWRSLWSTQSLLTLGHRWKIEDCSNINVWSMPWIHSIPSHKPSTPPPPLFEDLTVNQLMNLDCFSWNHTMVYSLLNHHDVVVVTTIPLFNRAMVDTRIWKATFDGNYTVKSAYRICIDLLHSSTPIQADIPWMNIWSLKIPHSVRSFLWRLAHQCLPTRNNLTTRGIPCEDSCVVCDSFAESHIHLFFVCIKAKECWESIGMGNLIRELLHQANNFTTLLFDFLDRLSNHQQLLVVILLWSLWKSRNAKLWESSDTPATVIITRAKEILHEWTCMQRAKPQVQNTNHIISWVKLPSGVIKCDVDAAIFHNNTIVGYGICFRNSEGQFSMAKSAFFPSSMTVLKVEATALLEAIKLAASLGFQAVQFETNCMTFANTIHSTSTHLNEAGDIISQCRGLLFTNTDFKVSYIRRQVNRVAHSIARASLSHPSPHLFYSVPSTLYSLFLNEMH